MVSIGGTCGLGSCSDQTSQQATHGGSTNIDEVYPEYENRREDQISQQATHGGDTDIDMRYIQSMKIGMKI